jgi:hypothetical protein
MELYIAGQLRRTALARRRWPRDGRGRPYRQFAPQLPQTAAVPARRASPLRLPIAAESRPQRTGHWLPHSQDRAEYCPSKVRQAALRRRVSVGRFQLTSGAATGREPHLIGGRAVYASIERSQGVAATNFPNKGPF